MNHIQTLITLIASSSVLPLLAFLAILLRRKLVTGKLKLIVMMLSLLGLFSVIVEELLHHGKEFGIHELYTGIIVSFLTFIVLSKSGNHHTHGKENDGVKGLVLAEAFHSIFDGLAIGVTFLVTPLLGASAALGIFAHEVPKMLATLGLLRATGTSLRMTIFYGIISQIGAPVTAIIVYLFGLRLETEFHSADAAVIASLSTIILYILFLEVKHHFFSPHKHEHHTH